MKGGVGFPAYSLSPAIDSTPPGYKYRIELDREPGSRFVYVIVHTGENLDWLRVQDTSAD